jgi:hypothetical protein
MPNLSRDNMVLKVLRNIGIPNDTSTTTTQVKSDIAELINELAQDVVDRRLWREYILTGTYTIPASQRFIAFSQITVDSGFPAAASGYNPVFSEIASISDGSIVLLPADPTTGARQAVDTFTSTSTPSYFVNRGSQGIMLLGTYPAATALKFVGKASFQDLTASESWIINQPDLLIDGATWKMKVAYDKDDVSAQTYQTLYEGGVTKMLDKAENQGANTKQIYPVSPFTDIDTDFNSSSTNTTF